MRKIAYFAKIRLVEGGLMFVTLVLLAWLARGSYWPSRPNDPIVIAAGALWVIMFFYLFCGYLVTSALSFFGAGYLSGWRPIILGVSGAIVFAVHSFMVIKIFGLRPDPIAWAAWLLFALINVVLPSVLRRDGGAVISPQNG